MVNGKKDYLKDANGNTVITKLDEEILKKIALSYKWKLCESK